MRVFLTLPFLILLLPVPRADACTPPCMGDVTLGAHVLPSTSPAIPLSGRIDADDTATLIAGDGGVMPSSLVGNTLVPGVPLEPNARYSVQFSGLRCAAGGTATETFETIGALPIPTAPLGAVIVSEQRVEQAQAGMYCTGCSASPLDGCASCSMTIYAATRTVSLSLDPDTIPFDQVVDTTLKVDGVNYTGTRGFAGGTVALPVVSRCDRDATVAVGYDLEPGVHSGTLEVTLIGGATRTSAPFTFTLGCDGLCVKPNTSCGLPDQLCDAVPDAGIDAGTVGEPTMSQAGCGGCTTSPSILSLAIFAVIVRRRRVSTAS